MPLVTREKLRERARELADMTNSRFVSDTTFNGWIEEVARELYDLIIDENEDYETISTTFDITSGNTAALPANFYKMRGLDRLENGKFRRVRKFNFLERDKYVYTPARFPNFSAVKYRLVKDSLYILPEDDAIGTYKLWFVPEMDPLTSDSSTVNGRNGWDTYIALGAAIRAVGKEEGDTKELKDLQDRAFVRVQTMAGSRDIGEPESISDVRNSCEDEDDF